MPAAKLVQSFELNNNISVQNFKMIFGTNPEILSYAPGRINIVGEHTDYNMGYVLPAAIYYTNHFLVSKRDDQQVMIWAELFKEKASISLQELSFSETQNWINYVSGVFWSLKKRGYLLQGVNCLIGGNIPIGAGLSSSAALEVSIVSGLNSLFHLEINNEEMAKIAREAENDFVGVKCGIMDQFVALYGKKNNALFLDCEDLSFSLIPVDFEKHKLCLLVYDTGVKRKLASSEYNLRRKETAKALNYLRSARSKSYKDLTLENLAGKKEEMGNLLFKRARHVITENRRVETAVQALNDENFSLLGDILFRSHESLKSDYEVSCPELDLLYEIGKTSPECLGARMTGAGFGGSGIAVVKKENVAGFKEKMLKAAQKRGYCIPTFHEVKIGDGAFVIMSSQEQ